MLLQVHPIQRCELSCHLLICHIVQNGYVKVGRSETDRQTNRQTDRDRERESAPGVCRWPDKRHPVENGKRHADETINYSQLSEEEHIYPPSIL